MWEMKIAHELWSENLKDREQLEDLYVNWRIILKLLLERYGVDM
jgi:hypothetical protein